MIIYAGLYHQEITPLKATKNLPDRHSDNSKNSKNK